MSQIEIFIHIYNKKFNKKWMCIYVSVEHWVGYQTRLEVVYKQLHHHVEM